MLTIPAPCICIAFSSWAVTAVWTGESVELEISMRGEYRQPRAEREESLLREAGDGREAVAHLAQAVDDGRQGRPIA
jgi:hypothetical protein